MGVDECQFDGSRCSTAWSKLVNVNDVGSGRGVKLFVNISKNSDDSVRNIYGTK